MFVGALASNHEILRKKRVEFVRRERDAEVRRAELERQERLALEQRRQQEAAREQERHMKYLTAQELEEARKKVGGWGGASREAPIPRDIAACGGTR